MDKDPITKAYRTGLICCALSGAIMAGLGFYIGTQSAVAEIRLELLPCK